MLLRAAVLKNEIEQKLARRIPAALSPLAQQAPRLHQIGNQNLDTMLGGGLPLGSVCELTGPDSSGRTSIALSLLAHASVEGACAYVDVNDMLSPQSAAAAGVDLRNLLWIRFAAASPLKTPVAESSEAPAPARTGARREPVERSWGGGHPRSETKGLAPAIERTFPHKDERRRQKMEGTPGYPNQILGLASASQDQIEWERFNLRRVDETDPLRLKDKQSAEAAGRRASLHVPPVTTLRQEQMPWNRLDRALRATDQVLQSGGFRITVLDLASVAPEQALRIPSATWFRDRRAAQESDAILLLLTRQPCAHSSAACVLECSPGKPPTIQGVLTFSTHSTEIARQRTATAFGKKSPGRATTWSAAPAWMRAAGR